MLRSTTHVSERDCASNIEALSSRISTHKDFFSYSFPDSIDTTTSDKCSNNHIRCGVWSF